MIINDGDEVTNAIIVDKVLKTSANETLVKIKACKYVTSRPYNSNQTTERIKYIPPVFTRCDFLPENQLYYTSQDLIIKHALDMAASHLNRGLQCCSSTFNCSWCLMNKQEYLTPIGDLKVHIFIFLRPNR